MIAAKLTGLLKPFKLFTVTVNVVLCPCVIVRAVVSTEVLKSAALLMVITTGMSFVVYPLAEARSVVVKLPVEVPVVVLMVRVPVTWPLADGVTDGEFQ